MTSYKQLRDSDKQVQYAERAVEMYRRESAVRSLARDVHSKDGAAAQAAAAAKSAIPANTIPVSTVPSGTNIKRHIIGVDNISRINYEMIKNTPGNVPLQSVAGDEPGVPGVPGDQGTTSKKRSVALLEAEQAKTKMFKNRLFEMNDKYIAALSSGQGQAPGENPNGSPTLAPSAQRDTLARIQSSLIAEYTRLQREERKWFTLRELLLDANIELDLYSEQDTRAPPVTVRRTSLESKGKTVPRIKLGCINLPPTHTQSAAHTLAFSRSKRVRIAREPSNIM